MNISEAIYSTYCEVVFCNEWPEEYVNQTLTLKRRKEGDASVTSQGSFILLLRPYCHSPSSNKQISNKGIEKGVKEKHRPPLTPTSC